MRVSRFGVSGRYMYKPGAPEALERLVQRAFMPQLLPETMRRMGLFPEIWDYVRVSMRRPSAPHWDDIQ